MCVFSYYLLNIYDHVQTYNAVVPMSYNRYKKMYQMLNVKYWKLVVVRYSYHILKTRAPNARITITGYRQLNHDITIFY